MKHGGDLGAAIAQAGGLAEDWLDLSTGINPHAYPLPALPAHVWTALPGQDALDRLLATARATYQVPDHLALAAAPGTQAILARLPHILPAGDVAVVGPTYGSHADTWRRAGRQVIDIRTPFADLNPSVRVLVIVNPNNPDGRLVDATSLRHLAGEMQRRGGRLVIDEAFTDSFPGTSVLPHLEGMPALVLRSFGKFYGLGGVRLGFAAGPAEDIDRLTADLESWAVSGPALAIGTAALADTHWQDLMRARLADEAADLTMLMHKHGLSVFGGTPLFVLAGTRDAAALHRALARQRIWTRVFDYAPTWMRIGLPGSKEAFDRLDAALVTAVTEA
ncbi:threonine-phosphate decarboxylase CobD [Stappia indica]|uniref:threonine-phosphate decarboxylase CobD n=1 Tax=Stappia indica TaxID=538381 RepID=UPI001CD2A067|nr:threonine-phosphate decarboxylase CobD [Stappia indica]MCA1297405.1 threonine-phosphate decarboxylase CobD [Stappia indica]